MKRIVVALCFLLPYVASTEAWRYRNYRVSGIHRLQIAEGYVLFWKAIRFAPVVPEQFTGDARVAAEAFNKYGNIFTARDYLVAERGFTYTSTNDAYLVIAKRMILDQPGRYVLHSLFETFNSFITPAEVTHILSRPPIGWDTARAKLKDNIRNGRWGEAALNLGVRGVFFGLFLLMIGGGIVLLRERRDLWREQILLWLYGLMTVAVPAFTVGGLDRYRTPADGIFMMFLAAGICRACRFVRPARPVGRV